MATTKIVFNVFGAAAAVLVAGGLRAEPLLATDRLDFLAELRPYGLLATGDIEAVCSDVQGPLGSWGNVRLNRFDVNAANRPLADNSGIVVNGAFTLQDGLLTFGNLTSRGSVWMRNYKINGDIFTSAVVDLQAGSQLGLAALGVDFPLDSSALQIAVQAALAGVRADHPRMPVVVGDKELLLKSGIADSPDFVIDLAAFENASVITIDVMTKDYAVIEVRGDAPAGLAAQFVQKDIRLAGNLRAKNVVFSFPDAHALVLHKVAVPGTVIAMQADTFFSEGVVQGGMWVKSFLGNPEHLPTNASIDCPVGSQAGQINAQLLVPVGL